METFQLYLGPRVLVKYQRRRVDESITSSKEEDTTMIIDFEIKFDTMHHRDKMTFS